MNIYLKTHSIIFSISNKKEKKCKVKVEIENHNSGLSKKELFIRLSDEDTLSFLFCLKINQDNFQEIKSQQGLLVDFCAFGQKLIDLFHMCSDEEDSESPKYILKLTGISDQIHSSPSTIHWTLNFVETNPFKHLTHLSLKFCHGDSEMFKNHLVECIKTMKMENSTLSNKLAATESSLLKKLHHSDSCLSEAQDQVQQLKLCSRTQLEELRSNLENQIHSTKEKLIETESYYKSKTDQEKRDLESNFNKSVRTLESKIQDLERTNKCLCEENSKLENDIREGKSQHDSLQESYKHSTLDIQNLRRNKEQCDRTIHDLECNIQKLTTRVAVLEQELRDKEMILSKSQDMHVTEQESKNRYKEESQKKTKQIEKFEKVVKNLNEEVSKGNEIIQKLQNEAKHNHAKIKIRNQITTEQEKVLNERESDIKRMSNDVESLQKQLSQKEDEYSKLSSNLEQTSKKLEEANHVIKTNENVINWLNRQVTEYELVKQKTGLGTYPPRTQQTPQPFSNITESMIKYRPTSSVSSASNGDGGANTILSGLNTKSRFTPTLVSQNQVLGSGNVLTGSFDRNITANQGSGKDARYLPRSLMSSGLQSSVRNVLSNAVPISEEPEASSDHQQSLSSAYFPKPLMGPR